MLKDCLEIFDEEMKRVEKRTEDRDRIILDQYILDNGIYILVRKSGETEICTIKMDKKTRRLERMPNKRENAIIKYALPGILENNFSLKYLEETKKDRQNSKRNYKYNNHKYSNNGKKFHH